ncbi:unnamed protein product [Strongylus vulgaris]|uniref:Uncharacterized protein n=1 Tax=Strongylus vulgaris TaxID=40348 RepID=A0A3P7KHH8_STRVU|nr:unnamed protein product [Strongylus vulgaris]
MERVLHRMRETEGVDNDRRRTASKRRHPLRHDRWIEQCGGKNEAIWNPRAASASVFRNEIDDADQLTCSDRDAVRRRCGRFNATATNLKVLCKVTRCSTYSNLLKGYIFLCLLTRCMEWAW